MAGLAAPAEAVRGMGGWGDGGMGGGRRGRRLLQLGGEAVAVGALLLLALQFRMANVEHYSGSFDEGIRMQQLLLMELGYRPFRDIFASQGPLLLDVLFPLYALFGKTLEAARLGVSALSLLGVVGAWWAVRGLHPLAGLGAAGLLALSPGYLENSRLALAEIPSLAPCLWAVGCGLRWQRDGRNGWLVGAAVLGAFGVLIKPMAAPIVAPLVVLAVLRRPVRARAISLAVGAAAGLIAIVLLALDVGRVIEVLGGYRGGAQGALGSDARENLVLVGKVLGAERLGFLALGLVGTGMGLVCWWRPTLVLSAWPAGQLGLFLVYTDLADKHIVYLVPPLALLGGLGIGATAGLLARRRVERPTCKLALGVIGVAAIGLYAWSLPRVWQTDRELARDADERERRDYAGTREQTDLMTTLTDPTDFVLTDNPIAAYYARRPMPPWLVDTSGTRVEAGSLTDAVAIREAERYQPKVVGTVRRRLGKLDGFERWLERDYRLVKTYGSDPAMALRLYVHVDLEARARALLPSS